MVMLANQGHGALAFVTVNCADPALATPEPMTARGGFAIAPLMHPRPRKAAPTYAAPLL